MTSFLFRILPKFDNAAYTIKLPFNDFVNSTFLFENFVFMFIYKGKWYTARQRYTNNLHLLHINKKIIFRILLWADIAGANASYSFTKILFNSESCD